METKNHVENIKGILTIMMLIPAQKLVIYFRADQERVDEPLWSCATCARIGDQWATEDQKRVLVGWYEEVYGKVPRIMTKKEWDDIQEGFFRVA